MAVSLSASALAGASAIGSGVSGLLGIGANALSAYQQYQYQKDLMKYQAQLNFNYGKKSAENQYMWQRKGLENANFNPMLAWQGSEGVANTGWTSPQSAPNPDYNSGIKNALDFYNSYENAQLMEKQGVQAISNANLNDEQVNVAKSQVTLNNAESMLKMLQHEGQMIENRLKSVDLDWREKNYLIDYMHKLSNIERNTVMNTTDYMNATAHQNSVAGQLEVFDKQAKLLEKQGLLTEEQTKNIRNSMKGLTFDQITGLIKTLGTAVVSIYLLRKAPNLKNIITPAGYGANPQGIIKNMNLK